MVKLSFVGFYYLMGFTVCATNGFKNYPNMLSNTLEHLDNGNNCTFVWSAKFSIPEYLKNGGPFVSVEPISNSVKMFEILRKETFCVISVIQWQSKSSSALTDLVSNSRVIDNHNTVYIGKEKPPDLMLAGIKRPLIWIKNAAKDLALQEIDIYCPKMGKPPQPELKTLVFNNSKFYNVKSTIQESLSIACHNPMNGQLITLAALPARPQIHFPNTVGNEKMSGMVANLFFLYAKLYHFKPKLTFNVGGSFIPQNRSYTPGQYNSVMTGKAEISMGGLNEVFNMFDFGSPLKLTNAVYMTRLPAQVTKYDKIIRPFPANVWLFIMFMSSCFAFVIFVIHNVLTSEEIRQHQLVKEERLTFNLFLFPVTKIIEPDALPWFEKWSSGKFVYFLWMLFCTFIVLFYTSNLRAYLVYVDYEKSPESIQDIYERGQKVYIYSQISI